MMSARPGFPDQGSRGSSHGLGCWARPSTAGGPAGRPDAAGLDAASSVTRPRYPGFLSADAADAADPGGPGWRRYGYRRSVCYLTLLDRDVVALRRAGVDLARPGNLGRRVVQHLLVVRQPAGEAADGEQHGEHVRREAHRAVDQARVEVDVRIELARDEVVVRQRPILELHGEVQQFVVAADLAKDLVAGLLDDLRPRVVVLVDPVAEAQQVHAGFLVLHLGDEVIDIAASVPDLLKHLKDGR